MSRRQPPPIPDAEADGSSDEQMINELMQKRKLQQEALLKIMTSMDQPQTETPEASRRNKKLIAKANAGNSKKKN